MKELDSFYAPAQSDHFHEECGVFGIFNSPDAAANTALGLHALQHRGQEASGIVVFDGCQFRSHRACGRVGDSFNSNKGIIKQLSGNGAIGHNRYATQGESALRNVQPIFVDLEFGGFALAHNGNITNAVTLRDHLVKQGAIFHSTTDTETIVHLMAMAKNKGVKERLAEALNQVEGAYSLVALYKGGLIAARDPRGMRPLVLGKLGDAMVVASESCAFDIIGADFVRDIEPGEVLVCTKDGCKSSYPFPPHPKRFCIFEYVYFARPDSLVEGTSVYAARRQIGAQLAYESWVEADLVIPVPDSGVPAAIGYANQARQSFELGIIRNHYVGRTFIEPEDHIRHFGVKLKHNANRHLIKGQRIVLVDDSIVRGTTSIKIVEMLRAAGAREVHMRIASPPTINPCYFGVDTPEQDQLLAFRFNLNIEEMAKQIGVDSLAFISINGLYQAIKQHDRDTDQPAFCDACFTGDYPIKLTDQQARQSGEQDLPLLKELVLS